MNEAEYLRERIATISEDMKCVYAQYDVPKGLRAAMWIHIIGLRNALKDAPATTEPPAGSGREV